MSKLLIFLVDEAKTRHGGIETINEFMLSKQSYLNAVCVRATLRGTLLFQFGKRRGLPSLIIVDRASTWVHLALFFLLRVSCWINAKLKGVKQHIVLREHHYSAGFVNSKFLNKSRFYLMLRLCYGLFDKVVAVSKAQLEWIISRGICPRERVLFCEHSGDISPLLSLPLPLANNPVVFGAMGRLCHQKGFDLLVEAWRRLNPTNAVLLLHADRSDMENDKQIASDMPSMRILGPIRPADLFQHCNWIVIPSRYEPYGQVCLEARAAGRPVIVTNVDGLVEQVESTSCGIICAAPDIVSIQDGLREAIFLTASCPEDYRRMSIRARESARTTALDYLERVKHFLASCCS